LTDRVGYQESTFNTATWQISGHAHVHGNNVKGGGRKVMDAGYVQDIILNICNYGHYKEDGHYEESMMLKYWQA